MIGFARRACKLFSYSFYRRYYGNILRPHPFARGAL